MLDLQPAKGTPARTRGRFGLALAGGGPLGAFYEIGALHAIGEAFEGFELTDLEMYVGVSSGAMIAAGLANGYDTSDMGVVFVHNASDQFPMDPAMFLRPAFREYRRRLAGLPALARDILVQYLRDPTRSWTEAVDPIGRLLPNGLLDNKPLGDFLARMFSAPGKTNDFRELSTKLTIVATELNSGTSVRFGAPGYDDVPISRAIQASTALPGLYPPVQIAGQAYVDGALIRTMNASVLLEAGADFVVCINPLVAFDGSLLKRRTHRDRDLDLTRGGLPIVMSQTFRALIQSRMKVGMASYRDRYPQADVLLFEPDRSDDELFFKNPFRYSERRELVEHAYQRTRRDLLAHADRLDRMLRRHGMRLNRDVLEDQSRSFHVAVRERERRQMAVTGQVHLVLDRLEAQLRAFA